MQNKQQSPFMLRTKQKLRENIKAFIIILILQIIGLPLMFVTSLVFYHREMTIPDAYMHDHPDIYILISVISVAFAVLSGIIIALKNFSYLYKKTEVDMNLSLPLTSSQRFLSDFFSGLAVYIIPYVISVILSLISLGIGNSIYPEFYNYIFTGISLIQCLICGLLIMIMLYTLTTLVTVCCGNMFESFTYTILINAIIPVFFIITGYITFPKSSNEGVTPFIETLSPVMMTSPFGGLLKLAEYAGESFTMYSSNLLEFADISWFFKYSILTIILFFIAFLLYNKRKAEDVSKPFVFSFIYYIFAFALTICISGMLFLNRQYINAIVISAVIFALLEIIRNRGLKHVVKTCIYYVVTIVFSFSFVKISIYTDGFGQIYKTPDASDVKVVSLVYSGFYSQYTNSVEFTDKEDIKRILKIQSESLQCYKDNSDIFNHKSVRDNALNYSSATDITKDYVDNYYFEIAYVMKNGNTVYRSHLVPYNIWIENMIPLSLSQEYKDYLVDKITDKHLDPHNYKNQICVSYSKDKMGFDDIQNVDSDYINDLKEAYKKDIYAQTEDDIKNFDLYCTINGNYIGTSFTNTLKFLEKYKIDFSGKSDIENDSNATVLIADSNHIIKNNKTSTNIITESCGTPSQYYTYKYDSDLLAKLSQVAQSHYYTDKHCYVIRFEGNSGFCNYVIPPEYSELVEEFMASAELNDLVWDKTAPTD